MTVSIYEAKTHLSQLIVQVEQTGAEIVIRRHNVPVAKLVPFRPVLAPRVLGGWAGQVVIEADFDELPDEVAAAATVWEVEIKRALGKLRAPPGFAERCIESGFDQLDITFEHAEAAAQLPIHHADPLDRMLIAQALVDDLELVTADAAFRAYGVRVVSPD